MREVGAAGVGGTCARGGPGGAAAPRGESGIGAASRRELAFARRLARSLVAECDPLAVLLFGSWAKGTANVHSDVDLVVVLRERPSPMLRAALEDAVHGVPMHVDLLLWTPADIEAARADPAGFAGSVLSGAIALHGLLPEPSVGS